MSILIKKPDYKYSPRDKLLKKYDGHMGPVIPDLCENVLLMIKQNEVPKSVGSKAGIEDFGSFSSTLEVYLDTGRKAF